MGFGFCILHQLFEIHVFGMGQVTMCMWRAFQLGFEVVRDVLRMRILVLILLYVAIEKPVV
jgi:hypothetical protein